MQIRLSDSRLDVTIINMTFCMQRQDTTFDKIGKINSQPIQRTTEINKYCLVRNSLNNETI